MSAKLGESAPQPAYVESPAQLSGLTVLDVHESIGVVCLGRTDSPARAADTLSIVAGAYGPRRPDGQPLDYLYDDQVEVTRILDISGAQMIISAPGEALVRPNFASLYYRKGSDHLLAPVFTPLLPGVEHEAVRIKGAPLAKYAISEAGVLTINRTGRESRKKDVRVVGASESPGAYNRRLAVYSLSAAGVAVRAEAGLRDSPATGFVGYDLHIKPGEWRAPLGEYGGPAVVRLDNTLVIPFGGKETTAVRIAQTLDARQQRAAGR